MRSIRDQRLRYGPPARRQHRGEPHPETQQRVEWLEELVRVFGPHEVADWDTPPAEWSFDDWTARRETGRASA